MPTSRHQLAIAYRFTKDEKYVIEIKNQIIDWINNNPYCCGPNWVCAMDVGIRASNWLVALEIVGRSELIQEESFKLIRKINKSSSRIFG